ncbi:MAG: transcriptional regulator MraZ [Patescibacteria group bacterium]|nr:MAG: transcriptional regulator MraZ [Patescibacteria group bacterium]
MLLGQIEGKVSKKFQTAIPKQFRQHLGQKIIITKGIDVCLMIVSIGQMQTLLEGTEGKPFIDKSTRELQRYLFGNAFAVSLDDQGRFVLPQFLRNYAKIRREVVFVGIQRYVELWDKKLWNEHQKSIEKTVDLLTTDLSTSSGHE